MLHIFRKFLVQIRIQVIDNDLSLAAHTALTESVEINFTATVTQSPTIEIYLLLLHRT
jgi:hypothetical protein